MYSTYYGSRQDGYGYNADMLREGFDLLEARADCLGWWSVARRVLRSYGHRPVIRLRRSSDSAERDFYGIGPQGEVSTADVRAWNGWNLVPQSQDFRSAAGWTNIGIAITPAAGIAPDGTNTANLVVYNTDSNLKRFNRAATLEVGRTYTTSIYAKAAGETAVAIREDSGNHVVYNLNNGTRTITGTFFSSATITSLPNNWFRLDATFTATLTGHTSAAWWGRAISNSSGNGVDGTLFWGSQINRGTSADVYEPRTTTAAGDSFLVTLYDQSGLGRHATQATTTLQRLVCEQGVPVTTGGRLASRSVAADARRAAIGSSTSMFNQLHTTGGTLFLIEQTNDTAAAKVVMGNQTATNAAGFRITRTSTEAVSTTVGRLDVAGVATNGNSVSVAAHADSSQLTNTIKVFSFDPDNATAANRLSLWINGTANATTNTESGTPFVENASGNMTFGAAPDGSSAHDGLYVESAMFGSVISTTDRTTLQSRSGNFFTVTIA